MEKFIIEFEQSKIDCSFCLVIKLNGNELFVGDKKFVYWSKFDAVSAYRKLLQTIKEEFKTWRRSQ